MKKKSILFLVPVILALFASTHSKAQTELTSRSSLPAAVHPEATPPPQGPGGIISTYAGDGYVGDNGNGGPAVQAQFLAPQAVVVDKTGAVYIADPQSEVIRKVDPSTGIISVYAGTGFGGFAGDGGPALNARLNYPDALALDSAGNLYVSEGRNQRVRKITAATGIITTVAGVGEGIPGEVVRCPTYVTGMAATATPLCFPQGIALDSKGNLYIADSDMYAVRRVDAVSGILTTIAGPGYGYKGDGGPSTSATVNYPTGIAVDAADNIYFQDGDNCAIRKISAATGIIESVVGKSIDYGYAGACGLSGIGGPASAALISYGYLPGIAIDRSGNIFFSDSGNDLVRMISAKNGKIYDVAGTYQTYNSSLYSLCGYSGDGGPAQLSTVCNPTGVALDSAGNLYLADTSNAVIRKVSDAVSAAIPTPVITFSGIPAVGANGAAVYTKPETVTITGSSGGVIHYTTDGSMPTVSSPVYTAPFTADATLAISAFEAFPSSPNSPPDVLYFPFAPPPIISPGARAMSNSTKITITSSESTPIYYSTDGSNPSGAGNAQLYTGPFALPASATVRAATASQFGSETIWSPIAATAYTIASPPVATTQAATAITASGATLNGSITATNQATQYWFAYGTSSASQTMVTVKTAGPTGTATGAASVTLTGLAPNTTYYYKLRASDSLGTTTGQVLSFTTD